MSKRRAQRIALLLLAGAPLALAAATWIARAPLPERLPDNAGDARIVRITSAEGLDLNRSYDGRWNRHDRLPLDRIPPLLQAAFIGAEDRRFSRHRGIDWTARVHAVVQNLRAGRTVRGASTISEQVVRMLHPRPRGLWARWLEGFDAMRLERRFGKQAILAFYLNQVPYAARRRGVVQAARYYFDRSVDTLSPREMMALAVMIRAPSRLDLRSDPLAVLARIATLAKHLRDSGWIARLPDLEAPFDLAAAPLQVDAPHFVRHVRADSQSARVTTTVSGPIQSHLNGVLDERLAHLSRRDVGHAAGLVVEHASGAIRAWSMVSRRGVPSSHIDGVTTPRQPGSTLKPFVYAVALEHGVRAASVFDDRPLVQRVGGGVHAYQNYSRRHYGRVSLRDALGSSLNIPAVKALSLVGAPRLLARLDALGVRSLGKHPDVYGDGIALGNGAVTLFELVQAYATIANAGRRVRLTWRPNAAPSAARAVFTPEVSSLIADILSDDYARRLEFGAGGVLSMPRQTAVKTGTSSDHRDAWAIGFDHRYVVGIWMGNLDQRPMNNVSGATGPALALRSVFAELNRSTPARALYLSPRLQRHRVCVESGRAAHAQCAGVRDEWFLPNHPPLPAVSAAQASTVGATIAFPAAGTRLAIDPRLPDTLQRVAFQVTAGGVTASR